MRLANLADMKLLEQAREQAQKLFEADPTLTAPENQRLAQKVKQFWASASDASWANTAFCKGGDESRNTEGSFCVTSLCNI